MDRVGQPADRIAATLDAIRDQLASIDARLERAEQLAERYRPHAARLLAALAANPRLRKMLDR